MTLSGVGTVANVAVECSHHIVLQSERGLFCGSLLSGLLRQLGIGGINKFGLDVRYHVGAAQRVDSRTAHNSMCYTSALYCCATVTNMSFDDFLVEEAAGPCTFAA
eukprot:TRINITY_DN27787_c0_g1_i1.p1 TRINITY_DN27787_c0_g1~~TRINITY_DN27787_c0_g1_i1.p1  ORF type:complete len:106 (-),score=12.06 TRINITY_DN27787_c0_g1_i1:164-481(-)